MLHFTCRVFNKEVVTKHNQNNLYLDTTCSYLGIDGGARPPGPGRFGIGGAAFTGTIGGGSCGA